MTHLWDELEGVSLAGEYALEKWLGSDGSGAFFLTAIGPERRQAVIKLADDDASGEQQLAWWQKTARLAHPNLLALLDCGRTETANGQYLYAVFDYPDDNVASALQRGPLSETEARDVLSAVVDGLRYIHSVGMVHGAIDAQHIVAVGDRIQLSSDTLRECIYADRRADDLRALGALIHELLTTRAMEDGAVVELSGIGEPLRTIVRDVSTPEGGRRWTLDEIANALHPQSPAAVTVGIAPLASTAPREPESPVAIAPVAPPAVPRREPKMALPLLIPAVAAVAVAIVLAVVHRSPESQAKEVVPPPQTQVTQAAQRVIPPEPKPTPTGPPSLPQGAWRVIAYTFSGYQDAARKARSINEKWPAMAAEVFTPKGQSRGPFLVAIGGRRTRSDATALQRKARSQGLPRDTYIQNYSN